jgi:hypothetical protein
MCLSCCTLLNLVNLHALHTVPSLGSRSMTHTFAVFRFNVCVPHSTVQACGRRLHIHLAIVLLLLPRSQPHQGPLRIVCFGTLSRSSCPCNDWLCTWRCHRCVASNLILRWLPAALAPWRVQHFVMLSSVEGEFAAKGNETWNAPEAYMVTAVYYVHRTHEGCDLCRALSDVYTFSACRRSRTRRMT